MNEPFVPIEDLAKHFSVSVSTIRAWLRQGLIPAHTYIRAGNTYRFSISKVVDALSGPREEKEKPQSVEEPEDPNAPVQMELDFGDPDKDV